MSESLLRTLVRGMISEGAVSEETLGYIRTAIDCMGERLQHDRADIIRRLKMKLDPLGTGRVPPSIGDPNAADWIEFREGLVEALVDLGVDWGVAGGLIVWANSLLPLATPTTPQPRAPARGIPPAPDSAPFERYAWASQRRGVPTERDNSLEKRIAKLIKRHVEDNIPLPAQHFNLLMDLINQGLYSDILMKPSPDTLLYRGMHVRDSFIETLGLDPETVEDGDHSLDVVVNPAPPRHKAYVSSWTQNRAVADNFKSTGGNSGFSVVLIARAGDNPDSFLDCQVIVDELESIEGEMDESSEEVFCGGRVRLVGVEIINNSKI
jgi:hypothetical protein